MREKGMISSGKLAAWKARNVDETADLIAFAMDPENSDMWPPDWPERSDVLEETTIERTVGGHHGYAPTVSPTEAYEQSRGDAMDSATLWSGWYSDWRFGGHPDYEALSRLDFFEAFGTQNAGYNRSKWQPGSFDRAATLANIAAAIGFDVLIARMDGIRDVLGGLSRLQYWEIDFYPFRTREWVADDSTPVSSLECKVLTCAEYGADEPELYAALFVRTTPGDDDEMWNAVSAEWQARKVVALQLLNQLSQGIADAPDVRFWRTGSQTEGRGI